MKNQLLKNLAMSAKSRLINRNSEESKLKTKTAIYSPNVKFKIISNEDSDFIARANSLEEEDLITAFQKLIDQDVFAKLDPRAKEKYLFDTSDKYARFRKKLEEENRTKEMLS